MTRNARPQQDVVSVRFQLYGEEARELKEWAAGELRLPTNHVRFLLRREMAQRRQAQADHSRLPEVVKPHPANGIRPEW